MRAHGVEKAVLSVSFPGVWFPSLGNGAKDIAVKLARSTNAFLAKEIVAKEGGMFGGFASLPLPAISESIQELERALDDDKLDGVVLLSNYNGVYLGDSQFERIFEALNKKAYGRIRTSNKSDVHTIAWNSFLVTRFCV